MRKVTQSPVASSVNSNSNGQRGARKKPAKPLVDIATATLSGLKGSKGAAGGVKGDVPADGGSKSAQVMGWSVEVDEQQRHGGGPLKDRRELRGDTFVKNAATKNLGPLCDKGTDDLPPKPIGAREHGLKHEASSGIRGIKRS